MSWRRVERCCEHTFIADALAPGSVVIDLGMNTGGFASWIAERFACPVYGAEPDPDLYRTLSQRSELKVIPCALGGCGDTALLHRAPGRCPTLLSNGFQLGDEVAVEVVGFEQFLSRAGLAERASIDLVKVDIEGAELAMFEQAAADVLRRVGQFTVEFHDFIWPELDERVRGVAARLGSLGFEVIRFSLDNTDVLFVNRALLGLGPAGAAWLRVTKYAKGIRRRAGRLLPARCSG